MTVSRIGAFQSHEPAVAAASGPATGATGGGHQRIRRPFEGERRHHGHPLRHEQEPER